MKVALTHDYLNQLGGAERVLEVFAEMYPDAPIYTILYDERLTLGKFSNKFINESKKSPNESEQKNTASSKRKIITSFLDNPFVRKNHRLFIPLMPLAMRFLKIGPEYDFVISSSAGFAKGIRINKNTHHLAYIHTPLRYAWEESYIPPEFNSFMKLFFKPLLWYLKRWDYKVAKKPDILIANSSFISSKIKQYYNRDSIVVYPPVDLSVFYPPEIIPEKKEYFLAVGRFLHYKKFDFVIEVFRELGLHIKIVGQGPEEARIKKMAEGAPNIEFIPFVESNAELRNLYQNARALVFPQIEDFGLVAAEAIACGTPVIAYNAGGAKEIVNAHSGTLFPQQTKKFLIKGINEFIAKELNFKPEIIAEQARKFSKENFIEEIEKIIKKYFSDMGLSNS